MGSLEDHKALEHCSHSFGGEWEPSQVERWKGKTANKRRF